MKKNIKFYLMAKAHYFDVGWVKFEVSKATLAIAETKETRIEYVKAIISCTLGELKSGQVLIHDDDSFYVYQIIDGNIVLREAGCPLTNKKFHFAEMVERPLKQ